MSETVRLGWIEAFADQAATAGGHLAIPVGDFHALIYSGETQGSHADFCARLLAAGETARIIPARMGQALNDITTLSTLVGQKAEAIKGQLASLGTKRQLSLVSEAELPAPFDECHSLREKHQYIQDVRQSLDKAISPAQPFLAWARDQGASVGAPFACGQNKVAIDLLMARDTIQDSLEYWGLHRPDNIQCALIGPLPPFGFLNSVSREAAQ
ncbi:MAG: hypothetical protein AAGF15_04230 [Pseudomonadota bacterium]